MRVPAVLGFLVALLVGSLGLGAIVVTLGNQPPLVATLVPFETPVAITTLAPTPTPLQTAIASSPSPSPTPAGSIVVGTQIGQLAPDFTLPGLSGVDFSTANSRGRALWVNFMATWCPQCQDELPMMSLYKYEVGDAMDVLLVDVGEDQETVLNFMTGLQVDLPTALDEQGTVQSQWGAMALPVHFWLDSNGVVQEIVFGGAPRSVFREAILKVVPDASFDPEPTP